MPNFSVIPASAAVNGTSCLPGDVIFLSSEMRMTGNSRKEVRKVTLSPRVIIQPKSITGFISLTTRDPNPIMVVSAVYRQGQTMRRTVLDTSSPWL